ncbi:PTS transporter subunit EIIC [Spiroplasma clarkii]|uniref:PTS transporter subunit EIIC n=1 Tax=Spiroplasma clarkii TaxID=2139 RepID=UPI000C21024A|nr:PTS transporter subunit EIIC [Spiroplasma clarkii]
MNTITVGMMSIYFSFLFGYYIAIGRGFQQPIIAGLVSTAGFTLACLGEVGFFMDAKGLIGAIIFSLIATEVFIKLSSVRALNIKLPDGVPPAVGKSFALFLPAVITLACIGAANIIVLAPAVVTGTLVVTGNQQTLIADNADDITALFGKIGNLSAENIAKILNVDLANNSWISEFVTNVGNNQAFVTWYENQSSSIQAMTAALFLNQGSEVGIDSFKAIAANNIIRFGVDNGVIKVISGSYMGIVLGSTQFGLSAAIYQFFTSWFIGFATGEGGLGLAIVFVFFVGFFWFFGVHGSNLMAGIFEPIFWMILGINTALVSNLGYTAAVATGEMGVFTKPFFDSYMYVGGSGATLGLLVMTLAFSKRRELKEVAKYSTPAGIFQINEPVIFGYPIVLNPVYAVPFIFAPIINLVIGWLFSPAVLGVVKYSYVATPWTTPWFISAIIT